MQLKDGSFGRGVWGVLPVTCATDRGPCMLTHGIPSTGPFSGAKPGDTGATNFKFLQSQNNDLPAEAVSIRFGSCNAGENFILDEPSVNYPERLESASKVCAGPFSTL